MKDKICFVATSLGAGGAERNISILANSFCEKGYDVYIILLFSNNVFYNLDKNIKIIDFSLDKNRISNVFKWAKMIREFVLTNRIKNVISVGIKYGLITALGLRKRDKINLIVRGSSTCKLPFHIHLLSAFVGNKITVFVSQTKTQSVFLPKNLSDKVVFISNPFDMGSENLNFNKGFLAKRFICVARLNLIQKKQDTILKAFAEFSKDNKDYVLDFYGNDRDSITRDKLIKISEDLGLKNVNFYEECSDIHKKIIPATAFICSSSFEGMPNALIESLLLGIPCLSSNWPGFEEILFDKENCFIFGDCNDYMNLCNVMSKIANLNETEYTKLCNNAFNINREKYDKQTVLNKWEELFK